MPIKQPKADKTDVIIIGAGISALLSALALSKEGKKVLIFEKSDTIGGNARSYNIDGYTIDTGPHAITGLRKGPLKRLMNIYANGLPKMVSHGNYYFRTKKDLCPVPASLKDWFSFNAISKKDRLIFTILILHEITKNITPGKNTEKSVYDIIKNYSLSKNAISLIDTLCYFLSGTSMKKTPSARMFAGFGVEGIHGLSLKDCPQTLKRALISHNTSKGQKYPKGGLGNIISTVTESFQKDMVTIKLNSPVKKRIIENKKAVGIKSGKKTYNADTIIYTGFVKDLGKIATEKLPKDFEKKLRKIKQAKSYTLWLGLKKPLKDMNYKGSEIWFESGEPFWAMPTSNLDPTLAPKGKQLIAFSFIVKNNRIEKTKKSAWSTITKIFPDIENRIDLKHEQITIPEKAAITTDSFFSGPQAPFKNLYFAGTDTDPRSMGITRAAHSVEEMLKVLKEDKVI